jgi:hypothetical protein
MAGRTPWVGSRTQIAALPYQVSTQGTGSVEGSGSTEAGGVVPGCSTVTGHPAGDPETSIVGVVVAAGEGVAVATQAEIVMASIGTAARKTI